MKSIEYKHDTRPQEESCDKSLEHYRKIIEALPEFVFIFDDEFVIKDVIMSSDTVLLHPVEHLRGASGRTIYSPEVCELFLSNIRSCLKDNEQKEIEYPLEVDGQCYYFQARIAPFEGNMVLALIHDISDRVQHLKELMEAKRKAEEADRMKSLFLANMSHEIRTPLNAIIGFSEIISSVQDEQERSMYQEIIHKNCNLLLQLIDDILDLSRIESGKSEIHLEEVSLKELLAEINVVQSLKMPSQVELRVVLPPQNVVVRTDRNRLTQVISNFMSNAIKNTQEGHIALSLQEGEEWVRISVADTGCGIPKEKIASIFNRFEKLNDFVQGAGLGLSICKTIVELLQGKIEVESEPGKGSVFTVCLPVESKHPVVLPGNGRKKVLVVDESDASFLQISQLLKSDYELLWARSGEEAIMSFDIDHPDLLIVDMRLPEEGAVKVMRHVRAQGSAIPIMATAGRSHYTERQQARQAGCDMILSKPYAAGQLVGYVDLYIHDRSAL
ncbi:MAG: response regulator [Bacteroides sp.]|nr:response regulator [Bacteroides sp.]